jgi:hypothetical protein
MLSRLLPVAALAAMLAWPAAAPAHHGGSGVVATSRVGDLQLGVSTQADVVAFAGEPDQTWDVDSESTGGAVSVLGYHCTESDDCQTEYAVDRSTETLAAFSTRSKRFHTRRGTRVGHTRRRAERQERRKARSHCDGLATAIVRKRDDRFLDIVFRERRVSELLVIGPGAGPYVEC